MEYILKKNNNKKNEKAYGKYYASPKPGETKGIDELSEFMRDSNTPYSAGAIKGILTDMVKGVKRLLLLGYNVKLDNLAIFSIGIKNKEGAASEEEFTTSKNIAGVRLRSRATGELNSANLNLEATLTKATAVAAKKKKTDTGGTTPTPGGSTGSGSTSGDSGSKGDAGGENVGL